MATVGFVGLGIMGRPMLRNLLKAGHTVIAFGRTPSKLDAAVADGAQRGASNADVGARASIIITMLPDGPEVEEVVLGAGGILSGAKPGTLIIDMSSISPLVSQKIAAACEAKGVDFIDAPVSGGEPKAVDGTLAIMAGGKPEVVRQSRAHPQVPRFQRHADRTRWRGQRYQARQSNYGCLQHRGHGRGAHPRYALRPQS